VRLNLRELLSGTFVVSLGLFALLYAASHYNFGSLARPGPGIFPIFLASVMTLIGIVMLVQSAFTAPSESEEVMTLDIELANAVWITASVLAFGLMLRPTGVIPATAATVLISTFADRSISWTRRILVVLCLTAAMILIFKIGFGMRVPLITGVIY